MSQFVFSVHFIKNSMTFNILIKIDIMKMANINSSDSLKLKEEDHDVLQ